MLYRVCECFCYVSEDRLPEVLTPPSNLNLQVATYFRGTQDGREGVGGGEPGPVSSLREWRVSLGHNRRNFRGLYVCPVYKDLVPRVSLRGCVG